MKHYIDFQRFWAYAYDWENDELIGVEISMEGEFHDEDMQVVKRGRHGERHDSIVEILKGWRESQLDEK